MFVIWSKMAWFRGMIILYPFNTWAIWQVAGATALLLLITVLVCARFRRSPWLAIGWFWYLGMLVPVIGVVQSGVQALADRFTYVPAIGLLIMLVWSLPDRLFQTRPGRLSLGAATLALAAVLCIFTWRQIGYWQDSVTLFRHALVFAPDNPVALINLGLALDYQEGSPQDGLFYYRKAVEAAPNLPLAQTRLGTLLERMGQNQKSRAMLDEGIVHLRRAAELQPHDAQAQNDLGLAYMRLGLFDRAISAFQQAVANDHHFVQAYVFMGDMMASQHRIEEASWEYQQALGLDPHDAALYFHIGAQLANIGRVQAAIPYMQRAVQLDPSNSQYRALLAQAQGAVEHSDQLSPTAPGKP